MSLTRAACRSRLARRHPGRGLRGSRRGSVPGRCARWTWVVCGSVAVNRDGTRLGKGAGYSDLEMALLAEAGLMGPGTVIVATVHPLQVLGEPIPEAGHDFSVDLIVTTRDVVRCGTPRRPAGLDWGLLPASMIAAIPVFAARQKDPGR